MIEKKNVLNLILILILLTSSSSFLIPQKTIPVIKFKELKALMQGKKEGQNEKISVINFWATWCGPCVKELPYFEQLNASSSADQMKVYLISLDDVEKLESRVNKFVQKKDLKSTVLLLDEPDYNSWIDKVSPEWSGAIPATLIVNHHSGQKIFHEGELTEASLNELIKQVK